jgi:hypothetical protein
MPAEAEQSGVMIVRIWIEPGHENGLRARLTESNDLASREQTSYAAASVEEIVELVRAWAERFVER